MHPLFAVTAEGFRATPDRGAGAAQLVRPSDRPATQGAGVGCIDASFPFCVPSAAPVAKSFVWGQQTLLKVESWAD
jgi:hypothetical protein